MNQRRLWNALGPGILLAAASIGASHLVLSPKAGAAFGFQLLWLVPLCHLLKYPAFEFGPRFAAATGKNLLQGYACIPGPARWPLVIFLVSTVGQGIGVLAAVVGIAAAVMKTWMGAAPIEWPQWLGTESIALLLTISVVILLALGGFSWLDRLNKVMMAVLAAATLAAFVPVFPNLAQWKHIVVPSVPDGSIVLIAAMLGWMPTGIDVSIWHSFWTLEKQHSSNRDPHDPTPAPRDRLRLALFDMRVGYLLSFATGVMFITMGAVHLSGRAHELNGPQFAQALSSAYTAIFGSWFYHVFMLTAFFAMFSTSYTVIDGFSRSFAECCVVLRPSWSKDATRRRIYFGFMLSTASFACLILYTVGNPVTLVLAATMISLAAAPLLYGFNLHCVTRQIKDPELRPSRPSIGIAAIGIFLMILVLVVTIGLEVNQRLAG